MRLRLQSPSPVIPKLVKSTECVYVPDADTFHAEGQGKEPSEQPVPMSYPPMPTHDPSGAPISSNKSPAQLPSPAVFVQIKVMSAVVSVPMASVVVVELAFAVKSAVALIDVTQSQGYPGGG